MEWSRERDGGGKRDGSAIIICKSRPQREREKDTEKAGIGRDDPSRMRAERHCAGHQACFLSLVL